MACTRAQERADQNRCPPPALSHQGKHTKSNKVCKSKHQKTSRRLYERLHLTKTRQSSTHSPLEIASRPPSPPTSPAAQPPKQTPSGPRKRPLEDQDQSDNTSVNHTSKRLRPSDYPPQSDHEEIDPIAHWAREGHWPRQYIEQDPNMERLLARKKSSSSMRSRKRSEPGSASSATPSDQKPREEKSAPYRDPRYKTLLETKGSFMDKSDLGISNESKSLCRTLLEKEQPTPRDSLFRDDIFEVTCQKVEDRNEARVMRDITPLIVPSAEILATYGAKELGCLIESTNEGWNNALPLTGTRPQPDYSLGFRRRAFSEDQLEKLSPFIGDFITGDQSFFMATYQMYFPFLTCEVKCGAAALDIADRQNAHSMTLAVRAVVELFRLVKRESELDRQILAFSISHDHRLVRIYGHYPVISDTDTKFYRHPIHEFSFQALDGRDKWTAYRFTKNVYDIWMPAHFERISSAICQLPSHLDFTVPPLPETGLSQELESHHLSQSDIGSGKEPDGQSIIADLQQGTPDTSFTGSGSAKRPRRKHGQQ
ncbi:hypothetical protein B0J13DRAFT_140164 [Dactylonectria estremocensis]|uniref:DUF7924 domain-containing protein n=1 Tax=Dactylonectria estremocensis TaxID=1079267 RepID=A0A9P9ISK7_9HYPO|nr:hypothetical protein B0J13DRAFT_140164 [Dactylonectria estremocensis]